MPIPTTEKTMDVPSRYEAFEIDIIGTSSPRTLRQSLTNLHNMDKQKQKVSDVAVAGESPILRDVASADSSRTFCSACLSTSKNRPIEIELGDNSATPSIEDLIRQSGIVTSTQVDPPQNDCEATVDLLTTESMNEAPVEGYGEANALRLPSSPESDVSLEDFGQRLPRTVQQEISRRRTRDWLNTLPNQQSSDHVMDNENSIASTISNNVSQNDSTRTSVLVVAPNPQVREVRIVLQKLNPQMLLKVPVHDIQNLFNRKPYSLSFPQIQKAMNTLITSAKIGLLPVPQKSARELVGQAAAKEKTTNPNGEGVNSSFLLRGRKIRKKRKLLALEGHTSNISQVIDIDSNCLTPVECPYSPLPKKVHKPNKKIKATVTDKKQQPAVPKPRSAKEKPSSAPKTKETAKKKTQAAAENLRKTRSSGLFGRQRSHEGDQDRVTASQSISDLNGVRTGRHEMTLRKKAPRRTSYFFQPKSQPVRKSKRTPSRRKQLQIVCTFLHRDQTDLVLKAVKKLGGTVENKVSTSTTHVVCGGPKRTINLLRGIARGCWLLRHEWVLQSMEKGHWVDEEPFELTNFSPAVQKCRIAKQTLGIYPTLFNNVGGIYVGSRTAPPKGELSELLKLCGGKIVLTTKRATVAVGISVSGCKCVTELWVLDSIQQNMLLPLQSYCLPSS